jgi:hypothetical protein
MPDGVVSSHPSDLTMLQKSAGTPQPVRDSRLVLFLVLLRGIQLTFVQRIQQLYFIVVITLEKCAHRTPAGVLERTFLVKKSTNFI